MINSKRIQYVIISNVGVFAVLRLNFTLSGTRSFQVTVLSNRVRTDMSIDFATFEGLSELSLLRPVDCYVLSRYTVSLSFCDSRKINASDGPLFG